MREEQEGYVGLSGPTQGVEGYQDGQRTSGLCGEGWEDEGYREDAGGEDGSG